MAKAESAEAAAARQEMEVLALACESEFAPFSARIRAVDGRLSGEHPASGT